MFGIKKLAERIDAVSICLTGEIGNLRSDMSATGRKFDGVWGTINQLTDRIMKQEAKLNAVKRDEIKAVTCDSCGCLVNERYAIAGDEEIRGDVDIQGNSTKHIYTTHYCKRCFAGIGKKKCGGK